MDTPERKPELVLTANLWSLSNHPSKENAWSLEEKLAAVKEAGFDAFCSNAAGNPELGSLREKYGLRFGGAFDVGSIEAMEALIAAQLEVDDGPMNCQLGDHDTPVEEAVAMTTALMMVADKLGAEVHLEVHRDTCTETPEKTYGIISGVEGATGKAPRVNFDYSHPAIVKHLRPADYVERLIVRPDLLQASTLLHIRPFNGHHCQIPITDGNGNFSPEYEVFRPFVREVFSCWLEGPRPNNQLWLVPELGPVPGYGLSCFPTIWDDTIVLGNDFRKIWDELVG